MLSIGNQKRPPSGRANQLAIGFAASSYGRRHSVARTFPSRSIHQFPPAASRTRRPASRAFHPTSRIQSPVRSPGDVAGAWNEVSLAGELGAVTGGAVTAKARSRGSFYVTRNAASGLTGWGRAHAAYRVENQQRSAARGSSGLAHSPRPSRALLSFFNSIEAGGCGSGRSRRSTCVTGSIAAPSTARRISGQGDVAECCAPATGVHCSPQLPPPHTDSKNHRFMHRSRYLCALPRTLDRYAPCPHPAHRHGLSMTGSTSWNSSSGPASP